MIQREKKIGVTSKNYASKRFILDKIPSARYIDIRFYNQYFWRNIVLWAKRRFNVLKLSGEDIYITLFLKFKFIFLRFHDFYVLHFFNTLNFSKRYPWVITIETCVPYTRGVINCLESPNPDFSVLKNDPYIRKAFYHLSLESCKGLMTLSDCSRNIQLQLLEHFPEYAPAIKNKLITLHPPQRVLADGADKQSVSDGGTIRFIFVGKDFFRKGGKQILNVFKDFQRRHRVELTLITEIKPVKDRFAYFTEEDLQDAIQFVSENKDWITHHNSLPNNEVLELIKKSHIGLLPTWMDTYGYSVLECQACGCPVISTNLRALGEINNNDTGWLIPVPVNMLNHPMYGSKNEFMAFKEALESGLMATLNSIVGDKQSIRKKANRSLERIGKYHHPEDYSSRLKDIYDGALIKAKLPTD